MSCLRAKAKLTQPRLLVDSASISTYQDTYQDTIIDDCCMDDEGPQFADLAMAPMGTTPLQNTDTSGHVSKSVIVISDTDSDVEVNQLEAATSSAASNSNTYFDPILVFWSRRTSNFTKVFDVVNLDPNVSWSLSCELVSADDLQYQVSYAEDTINRYLEAGYVKKFKVGITYQPVSRFRDTRYGYAKLGYDNMVILIVSDRPDFIIQVERKLIQKFRRWDRMGRLVNGSGNVLCQNHAPGGEGGSHGVSPFMCYLAIAFN